MKTAATVIAIIALLGISSFLYLRVQNKNAQPSPSALKQPAPTKGNAFSSVQDALSKSLSLRCEYKDEKGVQYTTYVKAGSVRMVSAGSAETQGMGNIIMNGSKMYMWDDKTKKGYTYTVEVPTTTPGKMMTEEKTATASAKTTDEKESVMSQIEKYKDSCKPSVVADSLFSPPKDVTFQDFAAMTTQMMKGVPPVPAASGPATSGTPNQADYQKMMNDYINKSKSGQ